MTIAAEGTGAEELSSGGVKELRGGRAKVSEEISFESGLFKRNMG